MPRAQTRFVCQHCGHESPRWLGRCPECEAWSSFQEEARAQPALATRNRPPTLGAGVRSVPITEVGAIGQRRMATGIGELDRVLGGGIVPGALMLVGGDPGIGKSTLLTQVAHRIAAGGPTEQGSLAHPPHPSRVLYVSGEESPEQIRLRAQRLGAEAPGFLILNETEVSAILHHVEAEGPALVVVDSIQTTWDSTLESAPGTVSQVRSTAAALARSAKATGIPVFLIGHVTKEGSLAGPRVLEHMVDTVLYFEGDRQHAYRIVRAVKNRFGSTDEIGLFEMREEGLAEVENPSAALLAERREEASGSAVTASMEGSRPLLVEVQALTARSYLGTPRRTMTGLDFNRVSLLLAVLEKRVGLKLAEQDVFVNVAGGIRPVEPAADLAVTLAIASSFREQPVEPRTVLVGEVGLGGEVRAVSHVDRRLREAARLGFRRAVIAARSMARLPRGLEIELIPADTVHAALQAALVPVRG